MDEVLTFEPRVGKVKTGLTTGGFTVIIPKIKFWWSLSQFFPYAFSDSSSSLAFCFSFPPILYHFSVIDVFIVWVCKWVQFQWDSMVGSLGVFQRTQWWSWEPSPSKPFANPLPIGLRRRLACTPISGTSLSTSPRFSLFSHLFFFFSYMGSFHLQL